MAFTVADREVVSSDVGHLETASEGHDDRGGRFLFVSVCWGEPAQGLSLG